MLRVSFRAPKYWNQAQACATGLLNITLTKEHPNGDDNGHIDIQ